MHPSTAEGHDHEFEVAALGWAGEHAAELGSGPDRLLVAGQHAGGARAAWLAIKARDDGWPELRRQVLVHPAFTAARPIPSKVADAAPATLVSAGTRSDGGSLYAARLRRSAIEVDELRHPHWALRNRDEGQALLVADLARSLRPSGRS
jgi:carboxylesterase type B